MRVAEWQNNPTKPPTGKPLVFTALPPETGKGNTVFLKLKRTLLQDPNTKPPHYFSLIKYSQFVQHSKLQYMGGKWLFSACVGYKIHLKNMV